ncbi:MAG: SurA N-terminal domain-containing protein [Piscirickettsiaceae bacterium]|nr:SurA N-terminal domain-containing protein [Piscirickettsiaceae bacterium]
MLHFIRERAKGWVAWVIVGLISIPFALWGVNSYLTGPADVVVATVNGKSIKQVEFQREYQRYRDRAREMMGEQFDPALFEGVEVKRGVLDRLIEERLLLSANNTLGQRVRDIDVNNIIQNTEAFQSGGRFDAERYSMMLARISMTPLSYESQLRIDLLVQELNNNIQQTALVTSSAIDTILRLEKQTRDIAYGVVSAMEQLENVTVDDEQVQAYFDTNKATYRAPERIIVDYIELSVEQLAKTIDVDDALLQQFYTDNEDQFVGPEQRRVSHILIEGDDDDALEKLAMIKERLEIGDNFIDLVAKFSQDAGTINSDGDLGFFQRDVMDPAFEVVAFAMNEIGDVSEPVKTEFGYHLIKLTDIKVSEGQSFSEVRDEIEALYRNQEAEVLFYEQAELLADLSYENPDNLDIAAEELGLEIKTSKEFLREGNTVGIAKDKKIATVAFSEDILVHDLNSAVIELNKSHLLVLHKNKYTAESQLAFESVSPAIKELLKFESARDKAREQGKTILTKLKAGESSESLFTDSLWFDVKTYSRTNDDVSAQVLQHAFSVVKPNDEATLTGFTAQNGNYIVVKVTAVNDGNPAEASSEDRDGLQSFLMRNNGVSELQAFIASLRADADIEILAKDLK